MGRRLAILMLMIGMMMVGVGGFHIIKGEHAQQITMQKAQALTKIKKDAIQFKEWNPIKGETIGILSIPRLKERLPIVEGTTEDQLAKGVGHYKTSALPNHHDQIVLSGHRDTVFRRFGELKIGDLLTVTVPYGSYTYKIKRMKIVDAEDRTIIHSTRPKEELVLTTCYPFHFIGNAPKRYIIYAYPEKN